MCVGRTDRSQEQTELRQEIISVCLLEQPNPLIHPLALLVAAGSYLLSSICLISPEVKCPIMRQNHHHYPALKKSEILDFLKSDIEQSTPTLQLR